MEGDEGMSSSSVIEGDIFGGLHVLAAAWISPTLREELERLASRDLRSASFTLPSLAFTSAGVALACRTLAFFIASPRSGLVTLSGESENRFLAMLQSLSCH